MIHNNDILNNNISGTTYFVIWHKKHEESFDTWFMVQHGSTSFLKCLFTLLLGVCVLS